MTKLPELAKTIRSKNAGVDRITFDIIFREPGTYTRVKDSGVITRESFAALYRIDTSRINARLPSPVADLINLSLKVFRTTPIARTGGRRPGQDLRQGDDRARPEGVRGSV